MIQRDASAEDEIWEPSRRSGFNPRRALSLRYFMLDITFANKSLSPGIWKGLHPERDQHEELKKSNTSSESNVSKHNPEEGVLKLCGSQCSVVPERIADTRT